MANAESECDTGDWIGNSRLESSLNARCVCAPVRSCHGKGIAQKDRGACRRDPAGAMIGGCHLLQIKEVWKAEISASSNFRTDRVTASSSCR